MGKRLDENLESVGFDNLIASMYPPAEVFHVCFRKEGTAAAVYKRGTLVALSDADGKYVIMGATPQSITTGEGDSATTVTETLVANAVLAEDVYVGTTTDEVAVAYRTGHFNTNRLIVADDYDITAADKEALRCKGILLSDAVEM